jgi:hypothetical protein
MASEVPIATAITGKIRPQTVMGPDITVVFDRNRGEFKPAGKTISRVA